MCAAPHNFLEARGDSAALVLGEQRAAVEAPSSLRELLLVHAGSDVLATDEDFVVFHFARSVWVVPETTPGLNALMFDHWYAALCGSEDVFEVDVDEIPVAWRKRFFGIPRPVPALGVHSDATLPIWTRKTRVDMASLPKRVEPGHG
jgi:hypothetical protein